jgi:hypothetical protein
LTGQVVPRALEGVLWAELWLSGGLPKAQLKAAAKSVSSSSSSSSSGSSSSGSSGSSSSSHPRLAVSSLSARSSWLLLRQRKDAAVVLLDWGLARLSPQEDFEWLGLRPAAAKAYAR